MTSFAREVKPKLEPLSKIYLTFHPLCRKRRWWPKMLKSVVKPNNDNNNNNNNCPLRFTLSNIIIIRVFCLKAGPSLQAEKPRLQFCRRQVFHRKLRNQGYSSTRDLIGAVASRCFPHRTLSLTSEQTLKDLKRSQGHQPGGELSGFG